MADRRMFAKSVILYDLLVDMSHATQMLYIHLNMHADDDGFVGNPKPIMAMIRCRERHLEELILGGFLLRFHSGVVAITHWRVNNQIRKDRYKPTRYLTERSLIKVDIAGLYTLSGEGTPLDELSPSGSRIGNQPATQLSLGEVRKIKKRIGQSRVGEDRQPEPVGEPAQGESPSSSIAFENMVLDLYSRCCPSLPEGKYLCNDTRQRMAELEQKGWTEEDLTKAFRLAEDSEYLRGGGCGGWKADLHWLCLEDNLCKVLNGRFADYSPTQEVIYGGSELGQAELEAIQRLLASDG